MTTTPLPPLPKSSPEQDALFDHLYEYGVSAEGVHQRLEKVCQAYAQQARADLEAENARLHKLLAWIIDECHVYPEGDEAKAFAHRLIAAITHPKAGAALENKHA